MSNRVYPDGGACARANGIFWYRNELANLAVKILENDKDVESKGEFLE